MKVSNSISAEVTENTQPEHLLDEILKDAALGDEDPDSNKATIFDGLYDDIFEVELPSTLYGMHRDPDRTFIAFTLIDPITICTAKALHVDRRLCSKLILQGQTVSSTLHDNLTVEEINNILCTLDEM